VTTTVAVVPRAANVAVAGSYEPPETTTGVDA
jgi:hypothetical protein